MKHSQRVSKHSAKSARKGRPFVPRKRKRGSRVSQAAKEDLRSKILRVIIERPLNKVEISKALNLSHTERSKLRDLLRKLETEGEIARVRKDRYILAREADLFTGVIQFHINGSAHVLNEKAGEPDLYIGPENTFTAMHGDRVVARIETARGAGWGPSSRPRREGRVIRILQRANETIVGTLQRSKNFFYLVADDPRFIHTLYLQPPQAPLLANIGDKVVAHLDAWPSRHVNPEGHIIEVLGPADKPGVDMLSIIRKYRLPIEFASDVLQEAEAISPAVDPREIARREDLRGRFIITIDPDDAKDFDDAVEVERTSGGWRVGIHIADVSHYVRQKSALDREALARGNSIYLADRVIPMLPEALSNGICSLKPGVERLTFSVFAEITRQGRVKSVKFAKSVIRSAARLTYKQAFEILQSPPRGDILGEHLHMAWELASTLRKKRFEGGSLDLDFPELKVWLDAEGKPIRLERIENDISHQLIEEFMLLANELVACEIKVRKQPGLYRIHEKPDPDKLMEFHEFAASQGVRAGDLTNRRELQKLLASLRGQPYEPAVKIALLKSLKRARYAPEPLGHYGLAKSNYTHFTSPIRRYSDLVVHRSLERLLGLTKWGPDSFKLGQIAEHISATERIASDAERESVQLKKLEFFQMQVSQRTGQIFRAVIMDVRNYGILVELPDYLLSGLIHVSSLNSDFFVLEPARRRLVGRRSRRGYQVGDEIEVMVSRVDMFKQQVDFAAV